MSCAIDRQIADASGNLQKVIFVPVSEIQEIMAFARSTKNDAKKRTVLNLLAIVYLSRQINPVVSFAGPIY